MTNAVAVKQTSAVAAALAAAQSFAPTGQSYMKMNANTGIYTYGKEEKELAHGSDLAVNMKSFALGWICWKDEEVVAELMAKPFAGEIPITNEADLPDHGPFEEEDGWSKQASVSLKILDTGEDVILKLSSKSGVGAMNKLLSSYAKELPQKGEDAVIIVTNSTNVFTPKNPKHGKKHAPVFEIVEWTTEAKLLEQYPSDSGEDDESSYEEKAPQKALDKPKEVAIEAPLATQTPPAGTETPGGRRRRF